MLNFGFFIPHVLLRNCFSKIKKLYTVKKDVFMLNLAKGTSFHKRYILSFFQLAANVKLKKKSQILLKWCCKLKEKFRNTRNKNKVGYCPTIIKVLNNQN